MTNPNPVDVAASIRQRLKNVADQSGRPFAEVLQWFVMPVLEAIDRREDFGGTWDPGAGWRG